MTMISRKSRQLFLLLLALFATDVANAVQQCKGYDNRCASVNTEQECIDLGIEECYWDELDYSCDCIGNDGRCAGSSRAECEYWIDKDADCSLKCSIEPGSIKFARTISADSSRTNIPLVSPGHSIVINGPPTFNSDEPAVSRVHYRGFDQLKAFMAKPGMTKLVAAAKAQSMTVEVDNIDWFEEGKYAIFDFRDRRERKKITKVDLPNMVRRTFPVKRAVTTGWRITLSSPLEYDHDAGSMIRPDDWKHDVLENISYVVFEKGDGYQHWASTVTVGDAPKQVDIPCIDDWCMGPNPFVFASVRSGFRNQVYSTIRVQSMFTPFKGYPDWQKFNIAVQTYKGDPKLVQNELVDFVVVRSGCTEDQCSCKAFKNNRDLMDTVMCIKNAGIYKVEDKDYAFETGIFWSKNSGPQISPNMAYQWNTVKFHTRFTSPPVVLANVQTNFGTDNDPYNIRVRNVCNESFEFIIDEETDRAHGSEWVAYYVIGEPRTVTACWLNAERTYNMNPDHVPHNAFYAPPTCSRYEALLIGAYKDMFFNSVSNGCGGDPDGIADYRRLCVEFGCGGFCTTTTTTTPAPTTTPATTTAAPTTAAPTFTSAPAYTCGDFNSPNCIQEYGNADNNKDFGPFCYRCENEGGANPLRSECQLCCDECLDTRRRLLAGGQADEEMPLEPRESNASRKVVLV